MSTPTAYLLGELTVVAALTLPALIVAAILRRRVRVL